MAEIGNNWDVLIVGAGPAGLFAANELVEHDGRRVVMVDIGKSALQRKCPINTDSASICLNCRPCNIMCGVGGAGIFSGWNFEFAAGCGGRQSFRFHPQR